MWRVESGMWSQLPELEGAISLEGPLLESVFAVHLILNGHNVVSRSSSYGVEHDILVDEYDGYVFYECTGQQEITVEKIDRFRFDAIKLAEVLKKNEGKPLKKAVFVAAVADDAWSSKAKEVIDETRQTLKEKVGCEVEVISGLKLLKQLLSSGALGLRLYFNRIYLAGPEDYAIRFDPQTSEFKLMYARLRMDTFRKTIFSFLPSHYWEMYYHTRWREVYEKEANAKLEPLSLWTYPYYEGLRWRSVRELTLRYKDYIEAMGFIAEEIPGEEGCLFEHSWGRRHDYYTLHFFLINEIIDKSVARTVCGRLDRIINRIRKERTYIGKIGVEIHTFTEYWTSGGWSEVHSMPETIKQNISYVEVERGNDILIRLLNEGILGLGFRTRNQITLFGPGVNAVRRTWRKEEGRFTLDIAEGPQK